MELIESMADWRRRRAGTARFGRSIGLVPTMGNLHAGHIALLARARAENEICVLSIFVNPTQFDNRTDLETYPRTLAEDLKAAQDAGVDFVLHPAFEDLYPDGYRFAVTETPLSRRFCGAHRPGHFEGVLTVVLKLLQLVKPHRAYFGEKDYQQLRLVKDMVAAFFIDLEIVACPTVRDVDGLALSSRNRLLSPDQRRLASGFPETLRKATSAEAAAEELQKAGFVVDYVEDFEGRRLAAVRLGSVRLIDNVIVGTSCAAAANSRGELRLGPNRPEQ